MGWIETLATVAPTLATAMGGPLAGMAVKIATGVLGVDNTEEALQRALATGDPTTMLALKQAEQSFQVAMRQLDIDLAKIESLDRDSARQRESVTGDSWTPRVLATIVVAGWMGTQFYVMHNGLSGETVVALVGTLGNALMLVLSYYFGASHQPLGGKRG